MFEHRYQKYERDNTIIVDYYRFMGVLIEVCKQTQFPVLLVHPIKYV